MATNVSATRSGDFRNANFLRTNLAFHLGYLMYLEIHWNCIFFTNKINPLKIRQNERY